MRREIIGLNEAVESFRNAYRNEPWFVSVTADHNHGRVKVMVRDETMVPGPPPGVEWKHDGFPVWPYPAPRPGP